MLQSNLFPKTRKEAPKEAESLNHKLLVRAGFVDQLMAGSWTLLPLGWRVVDKIIDIVREEMSAVGGQEISMPLLHPKNIWNETGRWDKAREVMYQFKDSRDKEYALSFTHEEIVMDLLRKHVTSYQDLPVKVYQFSIKFRNEARARSGILRGREFLMKDLYSAHSSGEDLMKYYDEVKNAYSKIFKRLGFDFRVTEASGGVFTENRTHEFQVLSDAGEDIIFYCDQCDWGANSEISEEKREVCPKCGKGQVIKSKSIEVGNIFPLDTWFSEKMRAYYTDREGKKRLIYFGSYGIGITRVVGTLVEVNHDEKGIVWPRNVAPFDCHLVSLGEDEKATNFYNKLKEGGIEVLFDDRNIGAGEKFSDADLIGIPFRLVVSKNTGDKIEFKERTSGKSELLSFQETLNKLTS